MAWQGKARQGFHFNKGYGMEQTAVKAIGGYHPITVKLINYLETGKRGNSHDDSEINNIAGIPCGVNEKGYGYLSSAIKYCEKFGVIWQRQRKENKILCLNENEIFERSRNDLGRVRRHTRRASNRLSSVDPNNLSPDKRPSALALAAQLGAIILMSKNDTTKKISSASTAVPQIEDVMKIFNK